MTTSQIIGGVLRRNVATETVIIKNSMPSTIVMNDGEDANLGAVDEHDTPPNA